MLLRVINGDPATPADEADVSVNVNVEDVRMSANINNDYTGELGLVLPMQITDRANGPSRDGDRNGAGGLARGPVPCVQTSGTTTGGSCQVGTTLDAVMPGAVPELKRSNWELGQIVLTDGGADGLVSTNDNTVFARQGVFVP